MNYVVIKPYVMLRVPNELGQEVLLGFYEGAVLPEGVNQDDLERHIRKGMVAEEGTEEADAASPVGKPVSFDDGGMPVTEPNPAVAGEGRRAARGRREQRAAEGQVEGEGTAPAGNASREDWASFAASKGAPDEETKAVEEGGLSRDQLREKYGS